MQLALVLPEGKFEVYDISKASQVIKSKRFRRDFRTVLYVHGFYDNYDSDFSKNFYNQYILRGRYNILTLNSSSLLKNILYPRYFHFLLKI